MGVDEQCIGCERPVGVGTGAFSARTPHGDGFLCDECGSLLRAGRAGRAGTQGDERILERIRQYGLGMAGGRNGMVGGPG